MMSLVFAYLAVTLQSHFDVHGIGEFALDNSWAEEDVTYLAVTLQSHFDVCGIGDVWSASIGYTFQYRHKVVS